MLNSIAFIFFPFNAADCRISFHWSVSMAANIKLRMTTLLSRIVACLKEPVQFVLRWLFDP